MSEYRTGSPPISIQATGTILNPWYMLPPNITSFGPGLTNGCNKPLGITPSCRVELKDHDLRLFFQNDEVVFVFAGDSPAPRHLVNPLRYFLTYQTFINYNLIRPATAPQDDSAFDEVKQIRFKVQRIVQKETQRQKGDKVIKAYYDACEDEWMEIQVDSITQYFRVLNPTLYYSIAIYLIGCDNPRYFLVEYYKAVEVIKNKFGTEDQFLESLKPLGVIRSNYKEFGKVTNDMRSAPLDIGRHAPMPGVPVYSVDLRNLLAEPRSREVLESSTLFCRQVINAYLAFLIQQGA